MYTDNYQVNAVLVFVDPVYAILPVTPNRIYNFIKVRLISQKESESSSSYPTSNLVIKY